MSPAALGQTPFLLLSLCRLDSPIGPLALAADADGRVRGVSFAGERGDGLMRAMRREYPDATFGDGETPAAIAREMAAYFAGDLAALTRIPWSLDGAAAGGGFQARVWRALAETAAGRTMSYGEMAARAGEPGAAKAAGVALNRNPIPLILPSRGRGGRGDGWVRRRAGAQDLAAAA